MKRLKGVLDGLRPGSSAFQSSKDKSSDAADAAPDAPASAADQDPTPQELLRPEHFKLAKEFRDAEMRNAQ